MASRRWSEVVVLHLGLVLVQAGVAGYQIITRVALTDGMNLFVFAVYRGAVALLFLIPAAFFHERNKRPPLTWTLMGHFFLLGLTGICLCQAFFLEGLLYTSPTFAAAIQNSIPAITFIIALAFGQEKLHIKRMDGQAKVVGTLLCVIGATLMVFYKGPTIFKVTQEDINPPLQILNLASNTKVEVIGPSIEHRQARSNITNAINLFDGGKSWQLGALYLMGTCIVFSLWLIIQTPVIKQYPARLSVTAFTSFLGTLQLLVLAICKERNPSKWVLPWGPQLLSVLYGGLIMSGLVFSTQMWCVQKGGAVLMAVYQPVQTIFVDILTILFLKDHFFLGSLIGGLIIIGGLYLVTWGQGKEKKLVVDIIQRTCVESNVESQKIDITQVFLNTSKHESTITQPLLNENPPKSR